MYADSPKHWVPPEKGQLKINCAGRMGVGCGGFSAIARDSSGDVIGVMYGTKKCNHPLEIQLHSILSALRLGEKLKDEGKHEGPVTVSSHHARALLLVFGSDGDVNENLEVDGCEIDCGDEIVADGLDEASLDGEDWCITLIGEKEIAEKLPRDVRDLIEKEKVQAGMQLNSLKK